MPGRQADKHVDGGTVLTLRNGHHREGAQTDRQTDRLPAAPSALGKARRRKDACCGRRGALAELATHRCHSSDLKVGISTS
jgi:hypothetical protein